MTGNINNLHKALEKLRLTEPLPEAVKNFVLKFTFNSLQSALSHFGDYSFYYGLSVKVYYLAGRMGLNITMAQSKIITGIISTVVASGIVTGAVYASKIVIEKRADPNISSVIHENIKSDSDIMPGSLEQDKKARFRIGINALESRNVSNAISKKVTDIISSELTETLGQDKILDLRYKNKNVPVNRMLVGSASIFGSRLFISVKVVDVETSKVIIGIKESLGATENVNESCKKIAERIAKEIKE